jgi:hypothetical protein
MDGSCAVAFNQGYEYRLENCLPFSPAQFLEYVYAQLFNILPKCVHFRNRIGNMSTTR